MKYVRTDEGYRFGPLLVRKNKMGYTVVHAASNLSIQKGCEYAKLRDAKNYIGHLLEIDGFLDFVESIDSKGSWPDTKKNKTTIIKIMEMANDHHPDRMTP